MGVQGLSYVVTDEQRPLGKWKSKCKGPEVRSITQWTGICPEKCSKNISMRGLWNPTHLEPGWFQQTSMPDTNWSSLPSFLQSRKRELVFRTAILPFKMICHCCMCPSKQNRGNQASPQAKETSKLS